MSRMAEGRKPSALAVEGVLDGAEVWVVATVEALDGPVIAVQLVDVPVSVAGALDLFDRPEQGPGRRCPVPAVEVEILRRRLCRVCALRPEEPNRKQQHPSDGQ